MVGAMIALVGAFRKVNRAPRAPWQGPIHPALGCPPENSVRSDSPVEGTGFEPSVPRKAPGILAVSALVRAVLPLVGNQPEAT
jgi:hypothetical protein